MDATRTDPSKRPLLLALPGLDGTGSLVQPLAARLRTDLDVEVVEYPRTPIGYLQLSHIVAPRLPRDRDFLILGESFAGPLALTLAAQRPPGLRGVVLCASFARFPHAGLRMLAPLVRRVPTVAAPTSIATRWILGRFEDLQLRRWLLDAIDDVPRSVLRARVVAALTADMTPALRALAVPLLYLRASDDRIVGRQVADEIARVHAQTTIVEVDGPHFLLQFATKACAEAVAEFVSVTTGRPR